MAEIYTAPTNLATTATNYYTMSLSWTTFEADIPVQIQRKPSGGTYSTVYVTNYESDSSWVDTTCSSNTRYYYRVRHSYAGNTSPWSDSANDYTYPKTPSGFAVSWSGKTATLTWTNADTYNYIKLYYKLTSEPTTWTTDSETLAGTLTTRNITVP